MANYWTKPASYKPKKAKTKQRKSKKTRSIKASDPQRKLPKYLRGGTMRSGK